MKKALWIAVGVLVLAVSWREPAYAPAACGTPGLPPPRIAASPNPVTFTIQQGGAASSQVVTLTDAGATQSWSASANPSGTWLSISPASSSAMNTSTTDSITITATPGSLTPGTYTGSVTITPSACGSTGSPITISVTLTVTAPPTIGLSPTSLSFSAVVGGANPPNQTIAVSNTGGGTLTWSASVTSGAFLSASGSGTNSGSITVAVNTAGLGLGTYTGNIRVSATGATNSPQNVAVVLTVAGNPPSIALSGITNLSLTAGGPSGAMNAVITRTNYTDIVSLTVTGLPPGVTAAVTNPGTSNLGTIQFTAGANATPISSAPVTVTASGNGIPAVSTTFALTVTAGSSIAITVGGSVTLPAGGAAQNVVISVGRTNFAGSVTLTVSGLPTGVTYITSDPGVGDTGAITLTATANATPVTNQVVTVTASGTNVASATASFLVSVTTAPAINISASGGVSLTAAGAAQTVTINVSRSSYTDTVSLAVGTLPTGITATFTQPGTSNSGAISLTAAASAAAVSNQLVTVTASGNGVANATTTFSLTVIAGPVLALSSTSLQFNAGLGATPATQTFQVLNNGGGALGWTGTVSGPFSIAPATGVAPSTITVSALPQTVAGNYTGTATITALQSAGASGSPRSVQLSIAVGSSCKYALSSVSQSVPASAGTSGLNVTTSAGCGWQAASNADWISLTSYDVTTGVVFFAYTNNGTGQTRTGTLTVAGQSFTVIQAAATTDTSSFQPSLIRSLAAGFYIVEATLAPGARGGSWGLEVLASQGQAAGGFNLGGSIFPTLNPVGFGAFLLSTTQKVTATLNAQTPAGAVLTTQFYDSNHKAVGGPASGAPPLILSQTLQPGFYVVEVGGAGQFPFTFQLGLASDFFVGGLDTGGYVGPGISGFGAFYLPQDQSVTIKLYGRTTYGAAGAGSLVLTLKDANRNVLAVVSP